MRSLSASPEFRRSKSPESASHSTDDTSAHLTPSDVSGTDLPPFDGGESYELRDIESGSRDAGRGVVRLADGKELDGPEDGSPLLHSRRSSVSSVQSYELYTPDEDRRVRRKLDRRLVAFMALLYSLSFLDRSSMLLSFWLTWDGTPYRHDGEILFGKDILGFWANDKA
jgi:hypothetical protein